MTTEEDVPQTPRATRPPKNGRSSAKSTVIHVQSLKCLALFCHQRVTEPADLSVLGNVSMLLAGLLGKFFSNQRAWVTIFRNLAIPEGCREYARNVSGRPLNKQRPMNIK